MTRATGPGIATITDQFAMRRGPGALNAGRALTYRYDSLNELLEEQSVGNPIDGAYPYNDNYDNTFSYDAVGNPLTFRTASPTNTFNSDNQLFNSGFGYDGNGNPVSYAGNAFTFDPENRATSLASTINGVTNGTSAQYDGDGMRAYGGNTWFVYDGDEPIVEMDNNGNAIAYNVFGPDGWRGRSLPPFEGAGNGELSEYFTYDPQGNRVQTFADTPNNGIGSVIADTTVYDGFGKWLGDIDNTDTPITTPSSIGFGGQWGYYTDLSTGYVFMTHRYYDPSTGRWINRDPIGTAGGINLYGFVGNNPITGADPNGTSETGDFIWGWISDGLEQWKQVTFPTDSAIKTGIGLYLSVRSVGAGGTAFAIGSAALHDYTDLFDSRASAYQKGRSARNWVDFVTTAALGVAGGARAGAGAVVESAARVGEGAAANAADTAAAGRLAVADQLAASGGYFYRVIETPKGPVEALAKGKVVGDTLELNNIAIYPIGVDSLKGVGASIWAARAQLIEDARAAGFKTLRITGQRTLQSSSRVPGHGVDLTIHL